MSLRIALPVPMLSFSAAIHSLRLLLSITRQMWKLASGFHACRVPAQKKVPELSRTLKRQTGFEPAALALGRRCSTTEPLAHTIYPENYTQKKSDITKFLSIHFS